MHAKCSYSLCDVVTQSFGCFGPLGLSTPKTHGPLGLSRAAFCMHLQPPFRLIIMQLQTQGERNALGSLSLLLPWSLSDLQALHF